MLVLFDHGTPRGLAQSLTAHTVKETKAQGWDTLSNGELLDAAEAAGFEVLLTTDKNIRHQQISAGEALRSWCSAILAGRSYACTSNRLLRR